ncbi:uncharacterized protein MELLADRAFT_101812 [Melampsora larici-populina 98AG31]|uniref:Uncharacterized protein n=1 Tax=Melampsora larici-populina (strain 98AG31 / pathotype 3-4-7) TaxID=747676 RepID=F4R501_MELLP|nr:uncharacterized protein MELLADRAFT_101812 [Melampsora larici-populina 98AG31]EGG11971.1 hypothetical protein MELLADRAFT_101812 [Melampsora larici-populina 98AG31]
MESKQTDLFGGAIKVELPTTLIDISQVRQVPDSQEVFILNSKDLEKPNDLSIIIEVLQKLSTSSSFDSIRFHFDSLANDNSAQSSKILKTFNLNQTSATSTSSNPSTNHLTTPQPILLEGIQSVSKFNRPDSEADQVHIWMALWTLNGIGNNGLGTDLVLTMNLPNVSQPEVLEQTTKLFQLAAKTLQIVDWNLFA